MKLPWHREGARRRIEQGSLEEATSKEVSEGKVLDLEFSSASEKGAPTLNGDVGDSSRPDEVWTEEEERAVRRKLDWRLVPVVTALYLVCFLDRYAPLNKAWYGGNRFWVMGADSIRIYWVGDVKSKHRVSISRQFFKQASLFSGHSTKG